MSGPPSETPPSATSAGGEQSGAELVSRRTDRFAAMGDDGRQYIVEHWTDLVDATTGSAPEARADGASRFQTSDGRPVVLLEDGRYQIAGSTTVLTSIRVRQEAPDRPARAQAGGDPVG